MGQEMEGEGKHEVVQSVSDLPVQDPPGEEFSAADLTWAKYASSEHHTDDVALIPYDRMEAFISGECNNPECPTRFHIERGRKRERGSLKEYKSDEYLLYRMYWCSFGPENYGEGGTILPSRRDAKVDRLASQYVQKLGMIIKSKLKYPLHTLLVFDSRQQALPVAWIITRSVTKQDTLKWMRALADRIHSIDATWRIGGFIIDDPASELEPIRDVFGCPIMFSLWHIRRTWLKNVIKKCSNSEVQREIFIQLGKAVYSIWSERNPMDALEQLFQDFVDQSTFVKYFKSFWFPKLDMWIDSIRNLPLASQESCAAVEGYHLKLKVKAYDDVQLDALQRVDWLVHKLTTELHSSYWLNLYADESGSFPEVKAEYIVSTSWQRALQIPDDAVIFDGKEPLSAKVASQKDTSQMRTVWNPGSEFSLCDCSWSMQGNLCKHVIKVNMMCRARKDSQPSLSLQSFQHVLLDLWQKPLDDSFSLDLSVAWVMQMQERIQHVAELATSDGIAQVAGKLPVQWTKKRGRRTATKRTSPVVLPHSNGSLQKESSPKNRKRKRLSSISS
ncbi:hypothetical protein ACP70R_041496 [Stipagrostis hirtigluma subsp. patula]